MSRRACLVELVDDVEWNRPPECAEPQEVRKAAIGGEGKGAREDAPVPLVDMMHPVARLPGIHAHIMDVHALRGVPEAEAAP